MTHGSFRGRIQKICVHRVARERLKGQWLHEGLSPGAHHNLYRGAGFNEPPGEYGALVSGNAARDAQKNIGIVEC